MTAPVSTAAMINARRADSATKRARVVAAVEQMARQGEPISFAAVARRAAVSTWLVYTPALRQAIEDARTGQPGRTRAEGTPRNEPFGAATDLALARAEIARLRAERDTQQRQLQLALGARLDDIAKADLVTRVEELTRHNSELASTLTRYRTENGTLAARVVELEDDLAASRTSLRRMIHANNRPKGGHTP